MSWNFNNIPKEEHHKIETALQGHDLAAIIYLHDRYEVSKIAMCCCEGALKKDLYDEIEFWYNNIRTE